MARWFRKERRSWGYRPCAWQGWVAVTIHFVGSITAGFYKRSLGDDGVLEIVAVLTISLILVTAFTSGKDSDA